MAKDHLTCVYESHRLTNVNVGWVYVNVTWPLVTVSWPVNVTRPPVTVSSHRKIKSSHHFYFPLLTGMFKGVLPFPTTVHFRVQVSSWGAALDKNSSFQAWFHSGSFWELGKSSKTSKLKTSPHDLATLSLVRLAGVSLQVLNACFLPVSSLSLHLWYQLHYHSHLSKFPNNVDMTLKISTQ